MALIYFRLSCQIMIEAFLAEVIYCLKSPFFVKNTFFISLSGTVPLPVYYTYLGFLNPF